MWVLSSGPGGWFGLIFAGIGGLFMLGGVTSARRMGARLRNYRAVPATVLESKVITSTDSEGSSTNRPLVRYTYHPGGEPRESDVTTVLTYSSSGSWAQEIVNRYPPGLQTQAYVDPLDDSKVFLLHEPMAAPYAFILISMMFVAIGLGVQFSNGGSGSMSVSDSILMGAAAWIVATLACAGHYRWIGGSMKLGVQLGFLFCLGLGLILLMVWQDVRADELANTSPDQRQLNPRPSSVLPIDLRGVA